MSLSITINNINDLTDAERAVLRLIVGDKQVTLTGPTATQQFIESLASHAHPVEGHLVRLDGDNLPTGLDADTTYRVGEASSIAPLPPIPASAELDSAGLPWDKRIHASTRAKIADGTWRKFRGVDDALVATVEAELRAVQNLRVPLPSDGSAVIVDVPPGTTGIAVERDPATVAHAAGVIEVPVPVPPAPTPTLAEMQAKLAAAEELPQHPVPVPPAPTAMTFADLMKHVTPMLVSGKLPQDTLLAVTAEFGLPHLAALGARPDLVEAVRARIDEVCNG